MKPIRDLDPGDLPLPYPSRPLKLDRGPVVDEYIIPEDKKAEVLNLLCFFGDVPKLDDEMLDLHADKTFRVRDFRVTRESGHNWLVSPYYPESGGTVIDWMPLGDKDEVLVEDEDPEGKEQARDDQELLEELGDEEPAP